MRVISRRALREFWVKHPAAEGPLRAWYSEARGADWRTPDQIRERYASASFVGRDRVVFNIGGNKYRLVAAIRFDRGIAFIRFIGTHAEYDKIDVTEI